MIKAPQTRHPRATTPELRTFFRTKASILDQPADWFKAQLLHYGLQPTDHKSTAAMRLLKALKRKELEVPLHVKVIGVGVAKGVEGERGNKEVYLSRARNSR